MEKREKPKIRIIWHSVAPQIKSGYGTVTRNVCFRLKALGYHIIISAYYGLHDGGMLKLGGVPILPVKNSDKHGKESLRYYVKKFDSDLPILHSDFWMFPWFAKLDNSCFYGPLDHTQYGKTHRKTLRSFSDVIACSKFGQLESRKYGVDAKLIPHGVDTRVFKPLNREKCREAFSFKEDKFIIGIVAANSDPEPRKGWDKMFLGIKTLLDNNPKLKKKIMVFAFTKPVSNKGFDLPGLAREIGIKKWVFFPEKMAELVGLPAEEMAQLYNCFNILLNCSRREGFGIPIIEAEACGIPVIATNGSSMIELVKGHGWLVRERDIMYTPLNGYCAVPDQDDIAKKIEEAYFNKEIRIKYGKLSNKFAQKYDWDNLVLNGWVPFLQEKEEEIYGNEPTILDVNIEPLLSKKKRGFK